MNIWEVIYDSVFESSSGMDKYSIPHENLKALVWTNGRSLDNVEDAITEAVGNQTRVTKLIRATWLGETINHLPEKDFYGVAES